MSTLYVRDLPEDVRRELRTVAEAERCSVNAKVIRILRDWLAQEQQRRRAMEALRGLDELRLRTTSSIDTVDLIREDRDR